MPLEQSRLRLPPLALLAPQPRAKRSVSAMRLGPHGAGSETRRALGRLAQLPSPHDLSRSAAPMAGRRRTGGGVQQPAGTVTRRRAAGAALIAPVRQRHVPPAEAGMVEQSIRLSFWRGLAVPEAQRRVQRLRPWLVGASAPPQARSPAGAAATTREPLRRGGRGAVPTPVAAGPPGLATAAREAGCGPPVGEGAPSATGGHGAGTGRLGGGASVGAAHGRPWPAMRQALCAAQAPLCSVWAAVHRAPAACSGGGARPPAGAGGAGGGA